MRTVPSDVSVRGEADTGQPLGVTAKKQKCASSDAYFTRCLHALADAFAGLRAVGLFQLGRSLVSGPIVAKRDDVDAAQVDVAPQHAWIARIGPLNLEIPLAALIGGVELDVDAVAVGEIAAELTAPTTRSDASTGQSP